MLKKISPRYNIDANIFIKNILWYFLSTLFFSRLFYVIGKWTDFKYITEPFEFFIANDYDFSLVGALVGFISVLILHLKLRKESFDKYVDPLVITFIFILFIGYIGAFLGGQVYGRMTDFGIEIPYNHSYTPIPYQVPIFPLPIIYSFLYFLLFSGLYISSMYIHLKGLIGYFGIIIFSSILLIFEFFSGKYDILKDFYGINMPQLGAIILIMISIYRLIRIFKKNDGKEITILHKK
ncbi:MAG: hypothetical protein GY828_01370 [Candidatus Gracilibacteria bacterium]|nr:hypothetical protein [Candidatus Gracilibacteria bacterium]